MANKKDESENGQFLVGTVVGFHALDGAMKVRPGTNNHSLLLEIETVTIKLATGEVRPGHVNSLKLEKGGLTLTLDEYSDRTAAEALTGAEIWTDSAQIAELEQDEWWIRDLIGVDVYTTEGKRVGTVCDVHTGVNELLEIKKEGGTESDTALVPFVKALVPVVDIKSRRIEIVNLPGLLD